MDIRAERAGFFRVRVVAGDTLGLIDATAFGDQGCPRVRGLGLETVGLPLLPNLATPKRGYVVQSDRTQAITSALMTARTGDCVVIAGKGHEDYQIIGTEKRPFDDRAVARRVLAGRGVRAGVRTTAPAEAKPS